MLKCSRISIQNASTMTISGILLGHVKDKEVHLLQQA